MTAYDVIVIGSGPGGLSVGLALAQAGKKVLVCEKHKVPGGWTHSFMKGPYRYSPGVHYIGNLGPGEHLRSVYEGLGVSRHLTFYELNPDGYDHIFIGDERFDLPKGRDRLIAYLQERFPHEQSGIEAYFTTVERLMGGHKSGPKGLRALRLAPWLFRSGQNLIQRHVSDPVLQAVLAGQSGDHGLPPSQVSSLVHAGIANHYLNGGYYPKRGAFTIPRAFVRELKAAGSEIRLKALVQKILIEDGRTVGVRLDNGEELRAGIVISNADPEVTLGQMVGRDHLSSRLTKKLDRVTYSTACVSLFFAVDMDLRAAGLDSGNFWFYQNEDLERIYSLGQTDYLLNAETVPAMFLTVTTLKDPGKMVKNGHHTCEAFCFVSYEPFKDFPGTKKERKQVPEYQSLKQDIADRMLHALDRRIPGIRENTVFSVLATPLTNRWYINATRGNLYGIAKSKGQVGPGAFPLKTEIPGLYMVGASTTSHGVAGATMSGLLAAKRILGCRIRDLLQQKGPSLRIEQSEPG